MSKSQLLITFFSFVAVFSGTKYLDTQSRLYQSCAGLWIHEAETAALFHQKDDFIVRMNRPDSLHYDGQACPALTEFHKAALEAGFTE